MYREKVYIYGAGESGKWLARYLKKTDITVKSFVVSDTFDALEYQGIDCIHLKDLNL